MGLSRARALRASAGTRRTTRRFGRLIDDVSGAMVVALIVASVLFLLLPIGLALSMSFDARDFLGRFPPPGFSLKWYARFFAEPYYLRGLYTSLALACMAAVLSSAIGIAAAVAIDRAPPGWRDALTSLFLTPLVIPGVIVGFALLLFYSRSGFENGFLRLLGAHLLITFPYAIRTVLAALAGIPPSLKEAALSLGANQRRAFWTVTLPLARTGIAAGAVFAFAFSLDDVAVSLFLSDPHNYTLPVALVSMMYANFDLTIAAASMLMILLTLVLMLLLDAIVGLDNIVGASLYRT